MTSRGWASLVLLLALAAVVRIAVLSISAPADDAYITFRYARNIAEGVGFVYNDGDRVLGTTTALFTLLLVPFAWVGIPLEAAAAALSILASLGSMLVLFAMTRSVIRGSIPGESSLANGAGLLAASAYGFFYASIAACTYGMECLVFEFLALGAIATASAGRYVASAALLALSALARPEGFMLAGILGAASVLRSLRAHGPLPWKAMLTFAGVVAPWITFACLYFGSPIPNSALAKAAQEGITTQTWLRFFILRNPVIASLWIAAAVGAFWAIRHRSRPLQLLAIWAGAYVLFFLVASPPFLGNWYFPPLASPLLALATASAIWLARRATQRHVMTALAAFFLVWIALLLLVSPRALQTLKWSKRVADTVYRPMALWIRDQSHPDALVEICDIGYVGYISGRRILDSSALVTPSVWREKHSPQRGVAGDSLRAGPRPDILVLPLKHSHYSQAAAAGTFEAYDPVVRYSVAGYTDIRPSVDPGIEYERRGRWLPDFLVCRRIAPSRESPEAMQ